MLWLQPNDHPRRLPDLDRLIVKQRVGGCDSHPITWELCNNGRAREVAVRPDEVESIPGHGARLEALILSEAARGVCSKSNRIQRVSYSRIGPPFGSEIAPTATSIHGRAESRAEKKAAVTPPFHHKSNQLALRVLLSGLLLAALAGLVLSALLSPVAGLLLLLSRLGLALAALLATLALLASALVLVHVFILVVRGISQRSTPVGMLCSCPTMTIVTHSAASAC